MTMTQNRIPHRGNADGCSEGAIRAAPAGRGPAERLRAGVILAARARTGPFSLSARPGKVKGYERGTAMSEVTEQQLEDMEALFVQTAASMTSGGGSIKLHGLSPSTLYFADRPSARPGT
jgi:hypothetical protein